MTFVKGKSGNPGGRPKVDPAFKKAVQKLTPKALKVLEKWMDSVDAAAAVRAANIIIEHAHGKPVQAMEVGDPDGNALPIGIFITTKEVPKA